MSAVLAASAKHTTHPTHPIHGWTSERYGLLTYIVLASFLALLSLFSFPRAVARFMSEPWPSRQGFVLRFSAPTIRDPLERAPSSRRPFSPYTQYGTSEKSPSVTDLGRLEMHHVAYPKPRVVPCHFPSWKTILYPLSHYTSAIVPLFGGYSITQGIVLVGYATLIGIALLMHSDPVTIPNRAGWIALSQFPVALALGSKASIVGMFVGRGYERLNFLHRWVGVLVFIAVLFHSVAYLVMWTKDGEVTQMVISTVGYTGLIALGGICFLSLGAIPSFRKRFYSLFLNMHLIGLVIVVVAVPYHVPVSLPYSLACIGIYIFDVILRLTKSHYIGATLHYIPELHSVRVAIPNLRMGWRAGQHIRLMIPSFSMGLARMIETHPFTIASPSDDDEGLVLLIKEAGDWTKSLGALARNGMSAKFSEGGLGCGRVANVVVQGPFGGVGHTVFSSYSAALFVCGGSGISFGLAAVQEMAQDAFDRSSRARLVDLVWSVGDPSTIVPLLPTFKKLIEQTGAIASFSLHIHIHYTRASSFQPSFDVPERIKVVGGRPDLQDMLYASISCASALKTRTFEGVHGVVMVVCGPKGLAESARKAERKVGLAVRKAVGGVELVEEAFGM